MFDPILSPDAPKDRLPIPRATALFDAARQPLARLRLYATLCFRLSLVAQSGEALHAFYAGALHALRWAAEQLSGYTSGADAECSLADQLVRTLFNLMRALQGATVVEGAPVGEGVADVVRQLLDAPDNCEDAPELKRASLQLLMLLPKESAM